MTEPLIAFHGKLLTMNQVQEIVADAVAQAIKSVNGGALYYDDINGGQWRVSFGMRAVWHRVSFPPPKEQGK